MLLGAFCASYTDLNLVKDDMMSLTSVMDLKTQGFI